MAARQAKLSSLVAVALLLISTTLAGWGVDRREPVRSQAPQPTSAAAPARRIVSLVPNVTEMLFAIGAGSQVVGVSSYDDFPTETKGLPRVGALLDPDTERILSLRPDLVIVYGSQGDLEERFTHAGIRVYPYRHGGIDSILQAIDDVAGLTGRRAAGDRLVRDVRARLDGVRLRVRAQPRPRTMLVIGRDAGSLRGVYVSGGVGFLHELLDIAGGDDIFGDITREAAQPSNETMIVRAPQVIVELHSGDQPPADALRKERGVWNLLASVPAVRSGRVYLLYGGHLLAAGPRVGLAADALARVLHPESFK